MNKRKLGSFALGVMLIALGFQAQAQQPTKVPRIGYLSTTDAATESARSEAIRLALRERGYVEGQSFADNINLEAHQFGCEQRQPIPLPLRISVLDALVLTLSSQA